MHGYYKKSTSTITGNVEVKSGSTINPSFFKNLKKFMQQYSGNKKADEIQIHPHLVYGGKESQKRSDIQVIGWRKLSTALASCVSG